MLTQWLALQGAAKSLYTRPLIALTPALRRWHSHARYIAITGSTGKTTTKDLLVTALGGAPVAIGNDNSNNQPYGIARTMLRVRSRTQYVVQEVGAGEPGRIAAMARQYSPGVALVLNVGTEHRSAFGDADGVAREKGALLDRLSPADTAVLNADDARVLAMAGRTAARIVTFGRDAGDVRGRLVPTTWPNGIAVELSAGDEHAIVSTDLLAEHFALNVTAAAAVAFALGVPLTAIAARLSRSASLLGRATLQQLASGITLIRDDWKAPAWTLDRSFAILRRASGAGRRFIVLGTVSDYPGASRRAYRLAVTAALEVAEEVLVVGPRDSLVAEFAASHPGRVIGCASVQVASAALASRAVAGDVVLLKGSNRADHLARIAVALQGRTVRCWRDRCGRLVFCDDCGFVGRVST